jgi:hypothetical protein
MSYLDKIIKYLPNCVESTESTNVLLSYFDAAFHGLFAQLDKANPLHHWAIDDFVADNPAVMRANRIYIDGSAYWIHGGMDLTAFRAEIQGNRRSFYFRFDFLESRVPAVEEIGRRLVIVGSNNRTRITLYDHGPGIE